jgi:RNA polymerase sigma-70 factor, ECF subfamily
MPIEDDGLVARVADGDTDALRQLYERHGGIVFGLAYRLVGDRQGAEECTQDVFVALWRGAASYDPARSRVSTWLYAITRNRSLDLIRRRAVRPVELMDSPPSRDQSPDASEIAAASERAERVSAALAELPEPQLEVLKLAYFEGLSHSEIAERLGIPVGTVKSRVRLALERLRALAPKFALEAERSG